MLEIIIGTVVAIALADTQSTDAKIERLAKKAKSRKEFNDGLVEILDSSSQDDERFKIPPDIASALRSGELSQYKIDELFRSKRIGYGQYKALSDMALYGDRNN